AGRRSGGRNPQDLSPCRREVDPVVGRRVRSGGGWAPHLFQEDAGPARRAGRSAAPDAASRAAVALNRGRRRPRQGTRRGPAAPPRHDPQLLLTVAVSTTSPTVARPFQWRREPGK